MPVPMLRLASFYFAYYAVLGAFTPYWSLYLQSQGMGIAAISVLMSLWYATRIVAPSTWTMLASRSSRPIRWLHLGCALTVICFAGFLMPWKFAGLFAVMCAFCFFYNAVMPQFESITQSHLHGRTDLYGLIRVWGSIGFILVVAGFGVLIDAFGAAWLPWMMLSLFVVLLVSAFNNQYAEPPPTIEHGDEAGFRARLRRPEVSAFFAAAFLIQVSFGPYYTFFSIYLGEHGYSPSVQGVLWSIGVLVEIGLLFLSQRIFRRWGARRLLVFSLGITVLRWWVTAAWPDSLPVMVAAQATHAFSFAAFFAAAMLLLAEYFPGRHNGHGQGVFYGLSSGVGGVIGALLAGQLWRFSGQTAFAVSGFIALAACSVAWYWLLRKPRVALAAA
ncbi:MFS transporter [Thermomonas sp. HDW16]|uniref:MFS transporter n=1 Tax=Thermomonas sp. HDW16 TaxID=2714945 RepID=UPI00140B1C3B|nr:MFS transporter [Thermomonas sp. HDW16]QIL21745.1 MFS transporter [Thermomonas sp. HDW16]